MTNLKRTIAFASLILAFTQIAANAQTVEKQLNGKASETELVELDRRIQEAMANGDVKTIEQYVGEDLLFTHGWFQGGTETKQNLLENAKKETRFYVYRKVSSQIVEMHDNVALVLGRLDVRRQPLAKNKETEQMCYALNYVHLYERRKGLWQFLSHRSAQMIEPSLPCSK
jgi:hypothetical protein